MPIDDKPTSAWTEADLNELCDERRRETQRLEFKRELHLDSEGQRRAAEQEAHGMATGGGGHMIYGIDEANLPDGGRAASATTPLTDGGLYERLEAVLDARGTPRLPFSLHEIRAGEEGFFLVVEIASRRAPHQASDGRYYGRRGTMVRRMEEAEVAEAYRDRFLREQREMPVIVDGDQQGGQLHDVLARVHHGLQPAELALREEGDRQPGWLSVAVVPDPPRELLNPVADRERFTAVEIPERWDADNQPLQYFTLQPGPEGLFAQLPPAADFPPAYLLSMYRDGLMEYGTTLEPALRHENPDENRIIFSAGHTHQIHDYLQAFAVVLGQLNYTGALAAQVRFDHTRDVMLGVGRGRDLPNLHPIEEERIEGRLWRLSQPELLETAGQITKEIMDRVFLAAGVPQGCWLITAEGELVAD